MADHSNSKKEILQGKIQLDGDLLVFSAADDGWIPTTAAEVLADATVIGAYTLPVADGNSGDVLSTNGAGQLSWVAP